MFRSLISWFRAKNLLVQAENQVLVMLQTVQELFDDSVELFWTGKGATKEDIRERDRAINQYVRDVRKKILTHLAFTGSSDLDLSLVMVNIVVYIERIGDYTKDIAYLATDHPGDLKAGELEAGVHLIEQELSGRLQMLCDIFSSEDDEDNLAPKLTSTHKAMNLQYQEVLAVLMDESKNPLLPADSAKLALYIRCLRRVEGHIYNVASAEVNPFHRISFKAKKKKK